MLLDVIGYQGLETSIPGNFNLFLYLQAFAATVLTEVDVKYCLQVMGMLDMEDVAREAVTAEYRRILSRAVRNYIVTVTGQYPDVGPPSVRPSGGKQGRREERVGKSSSRPAAEGLSGQARKL